MSDSPIGFAPQPRQAIFRQLMTDLRDRGTELRTEATTGRVADIAEARRGAVAEVLDLEKRLGDIRTYRGSIALAQSRAETMQASLETLEDGTNRLLSEATVVLQSNTDESLETLSLTARDTFRSVVSALNVSLAGRSLFAGDESDATAVAGADGLLAAARAALAGPVTVADADTALADLFDDATATQVYLGGTGDAPAVEVAPGERVAYHLRADSPELRGLLRGVATLAAAFDPATASTLDATQKRDVVERAVGDLRDTVAELNTLRAGLGSAEARIEEARVRTDAEEGRLTAGYNALTGRDTLEAATGMQAVESQLETLFLTTARFSRLSLASFLR
jgi:flagellar hook-associated protein 3 FlgL